MKSSPTRYIFKIKSGRLRSENWSLNITLDEALKNGELVGVSENQAIRFINEYHGIHNYQEQIDTINQEIKVVKKQRTNANHKRQLSELYEKRQQLSFIKDYLFIDIESNKDFDKCNKGFFVNGTKFVRLVATNGGIKHDIVIYVNEKMKNYMVDKIDNGRNLKKEFIPAKIESYKSLVFSASIPVPLPTTISPTGKLLTGVLVVNDCYTEFLSDAIIIEEKKDPESAPNIKKVKNHKFNPCVTDGFGLISPELSKVWSDHLGVDYLSSGFIIRNSYCKGSVFTFDFMDFAENVADSYEVVDAWGNTKHLINDQIKLILTTSQVKLWSSYTSIEDYMGNCLNNNYSFSVTKILPETLENERSLNYQFVQSLLLSDEGIDELIKPTIDEFRNVLSEDWRKTILFLKGSHLHEESFTEGDSDFTKALMIDKNMINDPFIRRKVLDMLKKRIDKSKTGVIKASGNFSILSGDPYILCESIFGMENPAGLLKKGEFYSHHWNEKGEELVACFRAPMTSHHNIRKLNLKNREDMQHWYKYMKTVTIFNAWDTTAESLNTADFDGDLVFTSNFPVLLQSINELEPLVCVQKPVKTIPITEEELIKANKQSRGDDVGRITNYITSMFSILANHEEGSRLYRLLESRIKSGQLFQQNSIDKGKGIEFNPMPKSWYNWDANQLDKKDKKQEKDDKSKRKVSVINKEKKRKIENLSIIANKQPYFFVYRYPKLLKKFKEHENHFDVKSIRKFKLRLEDLKKKKDKTEEEMAFIEDFIKYSPCSLDDSVMNKICWKIEKEFKVKKATYDVKEKPFDYNVLKTESGYSNSLYLQIKELFDEYQIKVREYYQIKKYQTEDDKEYEDQRITFKKDFEHRANVICSNFEELTNIIVELCYKKNGSFQQFAWDICGKQILDNLLLKNGNVISYPVQDANGEIEYSGERYTMLTKQIINSEEV